MTPKEHHEVSVDFRLVKIVHKRCGRRSRIFPQFGLAYPVTSLPAFPAYLRFTMNTDLNRKKTPEELELEKKEREYVLLVVADVSPSLHRCFP